MSKRKRFSFSGCLIKLLLYFILIAVLVVLCTLYSFKELGLHFIIFKKGTVTQTKEVATNTSNFNWIIEKTLHFEGGFQKLPTDRANYNSLGELAGTNFGISAVALENQTGIPVNTEHILNLTKSNAIYIYYYNYWQMVRGDEIHSGSVAWIVFDSYIHNPATACRVVEQTLLDFGIKLNTKVQKQFSVEIIQSINKCNSLQFFLRIKEYRRLYYESLRTKYPEFVEGWLWRLTQFTFTN